MTDYSVTESDAEDRCSHCGRRYPVLQGAVRQAGQRVGFYRAGMHQCGEHPRTVVLTIALPDPEDPPRYRLWSEVVHADDVAQAYTFRVLDGGWPWTVHRPAGRIMTRAEVRELAPSLGLFDITGNLLELVPHLQHFLGGKGEGSLAEGDASADGQDLQPQ